MNKLFFILLAVCLVTVHGYVKRDAPANDNYLDKMKTTFDDFTKDFGEKLKDTFDPEEMKKNLNQLVEGVNKFIDQSKTKAS